MEEKLDRVLRFQGSTDEVKAEGNEFCRFLTFYQHKWIILISTIVSIANGVMPILMMWIMSKSINAFIDPSRPFMDSMNVFIKQLIYLLVAMIVISTLSSGSRGIANPTCAHDIRSAIFSNLMKQEIPYFDSTTTGILVSRISEDVTFALETYITKFQDSLQQTTTIIADIVLSLALAWRLALISLAPYPICVLIYIIGEKFASKLWLEFRDSSAQAASKAEEVITSFRTVKSFNNELFEAELYSSNLNRDHDIIKKTSIVHATKNFFLHFMMLAIIPIIMYYGAYYIVNKPQYGMKFGNVFVVASCATNCTMAVSMLFSIIDDFRKANISGAKVLQLIDREPAYDLKAGNSPSEPLRGRIEFRNVCFHYETRQSRVLNDLSFTINPGETVAMVGESGCGKTTTLQLLQRFYEIDSGEILIDGVDIRTFASNYLRSQIAIVPQNPVLFSMSVLDNIKFARPEADNESVVNAARCGNAHDFICELPDSYETQVQQTALSGGQKQRICISRAILANAPILLLDEATAALDTESEQLVQQSLEEHRHGKTAIIVAHRLATVKNADRILVFKEGKIAEAGTHEDLIENGGIYADLVKYQLQ